MTHDKPTRHELIAFAKTGAPPVSWPAQAATPAMPFGDMFTAMLEGNISDAAWVDGSPTYSAVMVARDEKHPTRAVPRMTEQKPWRDGYDPRCCHRTVLSRCKGCPYSKAQRPESLNVFARDFHASNQRWWHDPATGEKLDLNMGELLMLVISEIAECMEGERKNLMDDHLPHRKLAEVELADAVIRIADIVGVRSIDIDAIMKSVQGEQSEQRLVDANKGAALLFITKPLQQIERYEGWVFARKLARCLVRIERYADRHSYDLWGAVYEKMEYNKHRADHKPEARLAANGKKF